MQPTIVLLCLILLAGCAAKPSKPTAFFEQTMLESMADRGCVLKSLEINRTREKMRVTCEPTRDEDF